MSLPFTYRNEKSREKTVVSNAAQTSHSDHGLKMSSICLTKNAVIFGLIGEKKALGH